MTSGLRLHHALRSSSSWRVRIVCALKGIDYDSVVVDLGAGEHQTDRYLAINPTGQVPCLEVEGQRIAQSVAIAEYLEEVFPEPPLLPAAPIARAAVRQVVELINAGIQPLHNSGMNASLREHFGATEEGLLAWKAMWIAKRLRALETLVARTAGRYAVGDALTLADVYVFPQLDRASRHGVAVSGYPTLAALGATLSRVGAFADTAHQD